MTDFASFRLYEKYAFTKLWSVYRHRTGKELEEADSKRLKMIIKEQSIIVQN